MLIGCVALSELLNLSAPPFLKKMFLYYEHILNIHNGFHYDIFAHVRNVFGS